MGSHLESTWNYNGTGLHDADPYPRAFFPILLGSVLACIGVISCRYYCASIVARRHPPEHQPARVVTELRHYSTRASPMKIRHLARAREEECAICWTPLVHESVAVESDGQDVTVDVCEEGLDNLSAGNLSQCSNPELPHLFHRRCLKQWLTLHSPPSCPVCRTPFTESTPRPERPPPEAPART